MLHGFIFSRMTERHNYHRRKAAKKRGDHKLFLHFDALNEWPAIDTIPNRFGIEGFVFWQDYLVDISETPELLAVVEKWAVRKYPGSTIKTAAKTAFHCPICDRNTNMKELPDHLAGHANDVKEARKIVFDDLTSKSKEAHENARQKTS